MKKLKIFQIKSAIGRPETQKSTLKSLGLSKLNRPVIKEGTPQIMGMIAKVNHLLRVEEVE